MPSPHRTPTLGSLTLTQPTFLLPIQGTLCLLHRGPSLLGPAAGSPSSYTAETTVSPILASLSPFSEVSSIPPIQGSLAALPNSKSPSPIPQPAAFPPGGFLTIRERVTPFRSLLSLPSVASTMSPFRITLLPPLFRAGSRHAAPPILRSSLTFRKILCPPLIQGLPHPTDYRVIHRSIPKAPCPYSHQDSLSSPYFGPLLYFRTK